MKRGQIIYGTTKRFLIDGVEVIESEFHKAFPSKIDDVLASGLLGGVQPGCWPMESMALAVHKSQVEDANKRNEAHGIATRYKADGTAVIPDRADRAKLLRLEQMHDLQGGFGDG